MYNEYPPSIGEILDSLLDESTMNDLEFKFFLDALATKISRRQAIIVRLMIMGITSQVEISKLLGYSFVTISLDIKKMRKIIRKILLREKIIVPKVLSTLIKVVEDESKEHKS